MSNALKFQPLDQVDYFRLIPGREPLQSIQAQVSHRTKDRVAIKIKTPAGVVLKYVAPENLKGKTE